jgi:hypothetical protein
VAELDLASLGLPAAQASDVAGAIGVDTGAATVVFRGRIDGKAFGSFGRMGVFCASEAWQARGDATASGLFYRVTDSGVRCITFPCPSLAEAKLNSNVRRNITGLDLGAAPGTADDKDEAHAAAASGAGVLVAGTNVTVPKRGSRRRGARARGDAVLHARDAEGERRLRERRRVRRGAALLLPVRNRRLQEPLHGPRRIGQVPDVPVRGQRPGCSRSRAAYGALPSAR